ncbi:hypothetical protein B0H17DRAFT_1148914 [Mycena rosella]|uniref:Uncharacterized protein n=1 Tax=Mycena rosella TaxID=1033263 RepID=A0AAD7FW33_MYCRO|nr:hypothetical protein B0H17DRAFT_1148914 [Mycena rosella]
MLAVFGRDPRLPRRLGQRLPNREETGRRCQTISKSRSRRRHKSSCVQRCQTPARKEKFITAANRDRGLRRLGHRDNEETEKPRNLKEMHRDNGQQQRDLAARIHKPSSLASSPAPRNERMECDGPTDSAESAWKFVEPWEVEIERNEKDVHRSRSSQYVHVQQREQIYEALKEWSKISSGGIARNGGGAKVRKGKENAEKRLGTRNTRMRAESGAEKNARADRKEVPRDRQGGQMDEWCMSGGERGTDGRDVGKHRDSDAGESRKDKGQERTVKLFGDRHTPFSSKKLWEWVRRENENNDIAGKRQHNVHCLPVAQGVRICSACGRRASELHREGSWEHTINGQRAASRIFGEGEMRDDEVEEKEEICLPLLW